MIGQGASLATRYSKLSVPLSLSFSSVAWVKKREFNQFWGRGAGLCLNSKYSGTQPWHILAVVLRKAVVGWNNFGRRGGRMVVEGMRREGLRSGCRRKRRFIQDSKCGDGMGKENNRKGWKGKNEPTVEKEGKPPTQRRKTELPKYYTSRNVQAEEGGYTREQMSIAVQGRRNKVSCVSRAMFTHFTHFSLLQFSLVSALGLLSPIDLLLQIHAFSWFAEVSMVRGQSTGLYFADSKWKNYLWGYGFGLWGDERMARKARALVEQDPYKNQSSKHKEHPRHISLHRGLHYSENMIVKQGLVSFLVSGLL